MAIDFFYWFKGSKIESYFMTAKMFESDTDNTSVISDLVLVKRTTVSILHKC